MYALENDERVEWNGNQWNPCYIDLTDWYTIQIINRKPRCAFVEGQRVSITDFVIDY